MKYINREDDAADRGLRTSKLQYGPAKLAGKFCFEPMNELADPEKLGGDRDIVCFHAGYSPDNEALVNNTVDFFMPYVGYKSANGKITDTMFDSVMFLTLQGNCPSGGKLTIDGGTTVISDWNMLLDSYFSDEYNLTALDKATSAVKSTLGLPDDHTTSVYLTIPFPKISTDVFGDYTGDGIDDKIESVDDCIEVIKWFMDEVNIRWTQKGYKNLTLKGYFYYSEYSDDEHRNGISDTVWLKHL